MLKRTHRRILLLSALAVALGPAALRLVAWGTKGHQMQARAALHALPTDLPAFFRGADEQMAYLISEPERWRTSEQPALTETNGPNHNFKWEAVPHPLPANRHLFLIDLAKQGKLDPPSAVRDFGTGAYAIQEWAERLTAAFRRWRAMPESTAAERLIKRQHERSTLLMAGVLGHWVTDLSEPMHASVHILGPNSSVPNPHGYTSTDVHSRLESAYVNRVISPSEVAALVNDKPRLLGDWLREVEKYIAEANSHIEEVFIFEKQAPFGGGKEPEAAASFASARLAAGARMLRDVWYTAWIRSQESVAMR